MCISWNSIHLKPKFSFFPSYASTSQPQVVFLNLYETERTSDSVGKVLWPGHLNVCHTRTNPKYSRICFAMFKLLSMCAKAKDNNLKLHGKIPNFEQKKIKPPKEESTQTFWWFYLCCKFWMFKAQLFIFYNTLLPLLLCHFTPLFFLFSNFCYCYFVDILDASL